MRQLWVRLSVSVWLVGCEQAPISTVPFDGVSEDSRNDSDSVGGDGAGAILCDPEAVVSGCADHLFCDVHSRLCVECLGETSRCVGPTALAQREHCAKPQAAGLGLLLSGGTFEPDPCESNEVCVPRSGNAAAADCRPRICEAGYATCVSGGRVATCDATGTRWEEQSCGPGMACYGGECQPVRHNVLLIFDTSGSMWSYADERFTGSPFNCTTSDRPCFEPYPTCEDMDAPFTLLGVSKKVFTGVVNRALGGFSHYALQRFPQFESPSNQANCLLGWYGTSEFMTGDNDSYDTTQSEWFSQNLSEIMAVGFPPRVTVDNKLELLSWLDGRELLGASPISCTRNADCGPHGKCGTYNGEGRCFTHSNPELRANGQTPLGKSLFYAGEYFRRYVRVDGKSCTTDSSCASAGYMCINGSCVDPYRECKEDYVIVFTDGVESSHPYEDSFFNPVVQAQRLAYGLECDDDHECRGKATCESGRCVGPEQSRSTIPAQVNSQGYSALSTPNGRPISIKVSTITLNGQASQNARIAWAGGGINLDVSAGNPEYFAQALLQAMSPRLKCYPEDFDALSDPENQN